MTRRNPPSVPADTSPEVWRRQMDAIATRTVSDRLAEFAEFNRRHSAMVADGIRRRHPGYDDQEVLRAQARLWYGDDLVRAAWPDHELVDP